MTPADTPLELELELNEVSEQAALSEVERNAFRALREQLLDQYERPYVAIYQGCVVAHDTDKLKLGLRVYQRVGYQPIYVQLVSRQGLLVKWLASPRR